METNALQEDVADLHRGLARMNGLRSIQVHDAIPRLIAFLLHPGPAVGLGTVLGATLLLSIAFWPLGQIDFIPIIGDRATESLGSIQLPDPD